MRRLLVALALVWLVLTGPARAWEPQLQCVPFARALSSVALSGDAWHWWQAAAGHYDRDQTPRAGSILSFRAAPHMPLGHIAVVTRVIGSREIEIDHANWAAPGAISREIQVIDVSTQNDWTAVRVELNHSAFFGGLYATNGFIHGRPVDLGPAGRVLRTAQSHPISRFETIDVAAWLAASDRGPHILDVAKSLDAGKVRRVAGR